MRRVRCSTCLTSYEDGLKFCYACGSLVALTQADKGWSTPEAERAALRDGKLGTVAMGLFASLLATGLACFAAAATDFGMSGRPWWILLAGLFALGGLCASLWGFKAGLSKSAGMHPVLRAIKAILTLVLVGATLVAGLLLLLVFACAAGKFNPFEEPH